MPSPAGAHAYVSPPNLTVPSLEKEQKPLDMHPSMSGSDAEAFGSLAATSHTSTSKGCL